MTIGCIGLGIMGSRMAANLQKHGHALVVYNRTPEKAASLIEGGAVWADTPAAMGKRVDLLFTVLAHPEAVEEAALGPDGFLEAMKPGTLWADCSTVHPSFSRQMARAAQHRQVRFVDAPVGGSLHQAARAELIFLVGGTEDDVAACRPFFEVMGQKVLHVGEQGMGISLKLVFNMLLATTMAAFSEGMALGQGLGISEELLLRVLPGSPVVPPFISRKQAKIEQGEYAAEFPLRWMQKDLQMASVAAYETGVAMPVANVAKELYRMAIREGLGDQDFSSIYRFMTETEEN